MFREYVAMFDLDGYAIDKATELMNFPISGMSSLNRILTAVKYAGCHSDTCKYFTKAVQEQLKRLREAETSALTQGYNAHHVYYDGQSSKGMGKGGPIEFEKGKGKGEWVDLEKGKGKGEWVDFEKGKGKGKPDFETCKGKGRGGEWRWTAQGWDGRPAVYHARTSCEGWANWAGTALDYMDDDRSQRWIENGWEWTPSAPPSGKGWVPPPPAQAGWGFTPSTPPWTPSAPSSGKGWVTPSGGSWLWQPDATQ